MRHSKGTKWPQPARRNRLIKERVHDPYHVRLKPKEGSVCGGCQAVYAGGKWRWREAPADSHKTTCPACQRTKDKFPAGTLRLSGRFFADHKAEILSLVRNSAEREWKSHPLHRIMAIRDQGADAVVTTTDIQLPRTIGQALHDAYSGDLKINYGDEAYSIDVGWTRAE